MAWTPIAHSVTLAAANVPNVNAQKHWALRVSLIENVTFYPKIGFSRKGAVTHRRRGRKGPSPVDTVATVQGQVDSLPFNVIVGPRLNIP